MVTLEKLMSDYWAQTSYIFTLLIGLLAYFVKRVYDLRTQKQITNHSLIQEHRIKAVNEFLNASTSLRTTFTSFPIYKMLHNEISAEEMDTMVTTPLDVLKARALEVSIFFPNENIFKEMTGQYDRLNQTLHKLYSRRGAREPDIANNSYASACKEILSKIDEKMNELTRIVGKTYSI